MNCKCTIVISIGNRIVILNRGKISIIRPSVHSSVKKYFNIKLRTLEKISKDVYKILKLKGNKKVNLLLLMLLNENTTVINSTIKTLNKSKEQNVVWKLLNNNKDCWYHLKKANYILANSLKMSFESNFRDRNSNFQQFDGLSILFGIEKFSKLYSSMIDCVINNRSKGVMLPSNPFYPEIDLYNDYLLSLNDIESINVKLLNKSFTTINERGIRDFIKRKLEESS